MRVSHVQCVRVESSAPADWFPLEKPLGAGSILRMVIDINN